LKVFICVSFSSQLVKASFKFLTTYLATFSGEDAHILSETKEEVVRAYVDFVKAHFR
jgi:translation initiation factor 3 subunit M